MQIRKVDTRNYLHKFAEHALKHCSMWTTATARFDKETIQKVLFEAALKRRSIESIAEQHRSTVSADTIHRALKTREQVEQEINNNLQELATLLLYKGRSKVILSVDFHQEPFFGQAFVSS